MPRSRSSEMMSRTSRGMLQRTGLAQALLNDPSLVGAAMFATSSVPTPLMVWWAAGFTVVALMFAVRSFAGRQL